MSDTAASLVPEQGSASPQTCSASALPVERDKPVRFYLQGVAVDRFNALVRVLGNGNEAETVRRVLRMQAGLVARHQLDLKVPATLRPEAPASSDCCFKDRLVAVRIEREWKLVMKKLQPVLKQATYAEIIRTSIDSTTAWLALREAGKAPKLLIGQPAQRNKTQARC